MSNVELSGNAGAFVGIVIGLFGVFVSIYWMWIGYRAMRAHERLADAVEAPASGTGRPL
jgi:hypothetical protein